VPFKLVKPDRPVQEPQAVPLQIQQEFQPNPSPPKLGLTSEQPSLQWYVTPTAWKLIMERQSYQEAVNKLKEVTLTIFKTDPAELDSIVPCIVDLKEAGNKLEEARIRRAQKEVAFTFAKFSNREIHLRPESKKFAFEYLKDDLMRAKKFYRDYLCDVFRAPAMETETKKRGKKKA